MTHYYRGRIVVTLDDDKWRLYWGNAPSPAGSHVLGIVTRDAADIGALVRTASGVYVQGNAGAIRSLNQRKVIAAIKASNAAP